MCLITSEHLTSGFVLFLVELTEAQIFEPETQIFEPFLSVHVSLSHQHGVVSVCVVAKCKTKNSGLHDFHCLLRTRAWLQAAFLSPTVCLSVFCVDVPRVCVSLTFQTAET